MRACVNFPVPGRQSGVGSAVGAMRLGIGRYEDEQPSFGECVISGFWSPRMGMDGKGGGIYEK